MATRNSHHRHHHDRRPKFNTNPIDSGKVSSGGFEMNESDVWNKNDDDHEKPMSVAASRKLQLEAHHRRKLTGKSSPVNVPDWSKILRTDEHKHDGHGMSDHDDDDEWLPPHEYLARTRIASLSVHEGVGRTLKGRDLSRVRNAIWEQTGFEQG